MVNWWLIGQKVESLKKEKEEKEKDATISKL
jgi:hypothetical protein